MTYFGHWGCKEDVADAFQIDIKQLKGCKIHIAWYGQGDYDGSAFVLFTHNDQLYEVNGGHCSCHGLEGQWEPEETTVAALRHRHDHGYCFNDYYVDGGLVKTTLNRWLKRRETLMNK